MPLSLRTGNVKDIFP